jgi:hypothetical protein
MLKSYQSFPGLILPSSQKLTLGLLATITLQVALFHSYEPSPVLLPVFKSILEVVFCKGVKHCLRFCLDHLNCDKMAEFQL